MTTEENELKLKQSPLDKFPIIRSESIQKMLDELFAKLPSNLHEHLLPRDGSAKLYRELPKSLPPEKVAIEGSNEQRAWELVGLFFKEQTRFYDALSIFSALYDHLLLNQENTNKWFHKGMPLVWMYECYSKIDFPIHAKRYLMLTLCEDAIREKGHVSPDTTGVYFRLVWLNGLPDYVLTEYATKIYELRKSNPSVSLYPEWILQELDQNWMTEFPSPKEATRYIISTKYVKHLIESLGDSSGKTLERLAEYLLSCMPGCKTKRRKKSYSTDYDIICSMEGFDVDFRSELGRYFVCECKDTKKPANFTTMAKFCRVLDSIKSRFGILFSRSGYSGKGSTRNAERERLKVYQDRGMVIIIIDQNDLEFVSNGGNFINLLRSKYEKVRLDLTS